jgi:hypothetical protein
MIYDSTFSSYAQYLDVYLSCFYLHGMHFLLFFQLVYVLLYQEENKFRFCTFLRIFLMIGVIRNRTEKDNTKIL